MADEAETIHFARHADVGEQQIDIVVAIEDVEPLLRAAGLDWAAGLLAGFPQPPKER